MMLNHTSEALIAKLKHIAQTSPTDAMDEALRLQVWTPGTPWHNKEVLVHCAQLAVDLNEYRLAGLAAYQAQRLHLAAENTQELRALPDLPGLEVAARQFNLIRYTPVSSRHIHLRRPCVGDREFLLDMFRDAAFARLYSRPMMGHEEGAVHQLIKGDQRCPALDTPWAWVIADIRDTPLGLIELHHMDFYQQSADFSMGFRVPQFSTFAGEALCLGLTIAFYHLSLKRVTHHIYGDHTLMHKLLNRMGSVKEYTLEGLVNNPETGAPASMTIYSITAEEARDSAWLTQLQRFCPSVPDLLSGQIEKISEDILNLGPSWEIFPPQVFPRIPDPPVRTAAPAVDRVLFPAHIDGRHVTLRPIGQKDLANIFAWLDTPGFLRAYPSEHRSLKGTAALMEQASRRTDIPLWLVERKTEQECIGLIGLEIRSSLPVLFVVAGFTEQASSRDIVESWQQLRREITRRHPHARVYLTLPAESALRATLESRSGFYTRGTERLQRSAGYQDRKSMAVLEHIN